MAADAGGCGHGMILGKFMPPHAGHEYLVQFARGFAQRLTVLVCSIQREPIPGLLRYRWMRELFPDVRVVHVREELPQEPSEHPQFWEIWRETVQRNVDQPIDFVFASEDYGHRLAQELQARYIPVDLQRRLVPVSGTAIRHAPLRHWRYLPSCVRPYFVKRVCLFGPESTGKSTLAEKLAEHFRTVHVPEFARRWLEPRQGICTEHDIPIIARGQRASEDALARQANRILFCDTDLLTTSIWSEVLFGSCPQWIRDQANQQTYDLSLLLDVDVPWVDDSQRYFPDCRQAFFDRCQRALQQQQRPLMTIRGDWDERFEQAKAAVETLLTRASCAREPLPGAGIGTDA